MPLGLIVCIAVPDAGFVCVPTGESGDYGSVCEAIEDYIPKSGMRHPRPGARTWLCQRARLLHPYCDTSLPDACPGTGRESAIGTCGAGTSEARAREQQRDDTGEPHPAQIRENSGFLPSTFDLRPFVCLLSCLALLHTPRSTIAHKVHTEPYLPLRS